VLWVLDRVSDGARVRKDLVVVTSLHFIVSLIFGVNSNRTHRRSLVAKEVDLFESLRFDELQTVRLVPAVWEDIERDLAAD